VSWIWVFVSSTRLTASVGVQELVCRFIASSIFTAPPSQIWVVVLSATLCALESCCIPIICQVLIVLLITSLCFASTPIRTWMFKAFTWNALAILIYSVKGVSYNFSTILYNSTQSNLHLFACPLGGWIGERVVS